MLEAVVCNLILCQHLHRRQEQKITHRIHVALSLNLKFTQTGRQRGTYVSIWHQNISDRRAEVDCEYFRYTLLLFSESENFTSICIKYLVSQEDLHGPGQGWSRFKCQHKSHTNLLWDNNGKDCKSHMSITWNIRESSCKKCKIWQIRLNGGMCVSRWMNLLKPTQTRTDWHQDLHTGDIGWFPQYQKSFLKIKIYTPTQTWTWLASAFHIKIYTLAPEMLADFLTSISEIFSLFLKAFYSEVGVRPELTSISLSHQYLQCTLDWWTSFDVGSFNVQNLFQGFTPGICLV